MTFDKKKKAIDIFVSLFGGSYKKLDPNDIDYKVFDKDNKLIAYAEVVVVVKTIYNAYPLSVEAKKLVKLIDKRLAPVVIWACEDGIIYGKANKLKGEIKFDSKSEQDNSFYNSELMVYYEKAKELKYVRFS
jgi:hypothetical protein